MHSDLYLISHGNMSSKVLFVAPFEIRIYCEPGEFNYDTALMLRTRIKNSDCPLIIKPGQLCPNMGIFFNGCEALNGPKKYLSSGIFNNINHLCNHETAEKAFRKNIDPCLIRKTNQELKELVKKLKCNTLHIVACAGYYDGDCRKTFESLIGKYPVDERSVRLVLLENNYRNVSDDYVESVMGRVRGVIAMKYCMGANKWSDFVHDIITTDIMSTEHSITFSTTGVSRLWDNWTLADDYPNLDGSDSEGGTESEGGTVWYDVNSFEDSFEES